MVKSGIYRLFVANTAVFFTFNSRFNTNLKVPVDKRSNFSTERETAKPMKDFQFPQWLGCNSETEFCYFSLLFKRG